MIYFCVHAPSTDTEIKGDIVFLGAYESEFDWSNETAKVKHIVFLCFFVFSGLLLVPVSGTFMFPDVQLWQNTCETSSFSPLTLYSRSLRLSYCSF